jgi:hypothetical protein
VRRNSQRAIALFEEAAGLGDVDAKLNLAYVFAAGDGGPPDPKKALAWYFSAAKQGTTGAQLEVGERLRLGIGARRNLGAARRWYALAAVGGDPNASLALALVALQRWMNRSAGARALERIRGAAEGGVPSAALLLGLLFERGVGVEQDDREAAKWYRRAALQPRRDHRGNAGLHPAARAAARAAVESLASRPRSVRRRRPRG